MEDFTGYIHSRSVLYLNGGRAILQAWLNLIRLAALFDSRDELISLYHDLFLWAHGSSERTLKRSFEGILLDVSPKGR